MKLLIDGDALVYPILTANLTEVVADDEIVSAHIDLRVCQIEIQARIDQYLTWAKAEEFMLAFSCPSSECFRRDLYPGYKANRKGTKPLGFSPLLASLKASYETMVWPRLEADDILGILQTQPGTTTMIVGVDKDFLTVPGLVMDPRDGSLVRVSEKAADRAHMIQTVTGDSTDGYPGMPGWGPVKALGIETWEDVLGVFRGNEEAALVQARLARILRWEDWDREAKKPILWSPKPITEISSGC